MRMGHEPKFFQIWQGIRREDVTQEGQRIPEVRTVAEKLQAPEIEADVPYELWKCAVLQRVPHENAYVKKGCWTVFVRQEPSVARARVVVCDVIYT